MKTRSETVILIVDDEEELRNILTFDLKRQGYQTLEAGSGSEALALAKQTAVDLVLSDVRMAAGDGIQLLHWLRELDASRPPFIFMTAFSDISTDLAFDIGAVAFLNKPVFLDNLLSEVESALQPRQEKWAALPPLYVAGSIAVAAADPRPFAIGQGGMFLGMETGFPVVFDILQFELNDRDAELPRLVGHGRVRWVREETVADFHAGIGLEFLGLAPDCLESVFRYLAGRQPKPYIPLGARA